MRKSKLGAMGALLGVLLFFLCTNWNLCSEPIKKVPSCHQESSASKTASPCDCPLSKQVWKQTETSGSETLSSPKSYFITFWNIFNKQSSLFSLEKTRHLVYKEKDFPYSKLSPFLDTIKLLN